MEHFRVGDDKTGGLSRGEAVRSTGVAVVGGGLRPEHARPLGRRAESSPPRRPRRARLRGEFATVRPPPARAVALAFQHVLTMFGATVSVPLLLGPAMGMSQPDIAILISSVMLCSGVATLLQSTLGSRLPIVQGVSFSFLGAFLAIIATGKEDGWSAATMMQYIAGAIMLALVDNRPRLQPGRNSRIFLMPL